MNYTITNYLTALVKYQNESKRTYVFSNFHNFNALDMPNHIKLPYSETSGHIPSSDRLHVGELWINGTDSIIGTKKQDGTIVQFAQLTPQERQKLLTADFIPKTGAVAAISTSALAATAPSNAIVINDGSDIAIEYTAVADDVINITAAKTTGHKATKVVINKPAGIHCTINWSGVDQWLSTVDQPVFGESDEQQELCVAIFTSKTVNAVNVIYNTEDTEIGEGQGYWGSIGGDIQDQQDLIDLFNTKADKTALQSLVPTSTTVGSNAVQISQTVDAGSSEFAITAQSVGTTNRRRTTPQYHSTISGSSTNGITISQKTANDVPLTLKNDNGDIVFATPSEMIAASTLVTKQYGAFNYLGINDTAKKAAQLATDITFSLSGGATSDIVSTNGSTNIVIPVTNIDGTKVSGRVENANIAIRDQKGNVIDTTYATTTALNTGLGQKVSQTDFDDTIKNYVTTTTANNTYATKTALAQKQDVGDYALNSTVNEKIANCLPLAGGELTGILTAPTFVGDLQGNADSATKATQDGNGDVIANTYLKAATSYAFTNVTISGKAVVTNAPVNGTDAANKDYVDSKVSTIDLSLYAIKTDVASTYATKSELSSGLAPKANAADLDNYLLKTGGTITGSLIVPAPTAPNHAATKQYVDTAVSTVYKYKGNVANVDALPKSGNVVGDVWNAEDTGDNYVWTGTEWDKLAGTVDLSGYLTKSEAQGKYITPSAVAGTYLAKSDAAAKYLTQATATSTYLSKTEAQGTYLSQHTAASTYLSSAAAANTYLSKTSASSTYLTKNEAASTYATPAAITSAVSALDSRFLQLTGGTVTGPITLPGDPTANNQAATKKYVDDHSGKTYFGTCSTAAATNAKAVTVNSGFSLVTGSRVTVLFTTGNTGTAATLNVNSTGAKPIWYLNTQLNNTDLIAGVCTDLVYDGTHWVIVGGLPNVRSYSTVESDNRYALRINPTIVGTLSIIDN